MPNPLPFRHAGHFWRGLRNAGHGRSLLAGVALLALTLWLLPQATAVPRDFLHGMVFACALLLLWWMQVESLLQQNRPMLARLVPGHVAALRRSLVRQWLLHTLVWTLLLLWQLDRWSQWAFWAAAVALVLFGLVWLVRHPLLWIVLSLLFFGGVFQLRRLKPGLVAARDAAQASLADPLTAGVWLALGALLGALLLHRALGGGGGAHRRMTERRDRLVAMNRAMQTGCGVPVKHQTGFMGGMHRLTGRPWQWLLARALRPGVAPASIGRLNLVLAGPSHWARQLGLALLIGAVVFLPLALLFAWLPPSKSGKEPLEAMRFGLCMGLFSMGLNPLMQLTGSLAARRREQGLLMLAPGVPQGAALRDAWTSYQVRQFFVGWGLCTAAVLGLMATASGPDALHFVGGFAAGCLPLVRLAWRDWARLKDSGLHGTRTVQVASLAVLGGGALAGALAEKMAVAPALSLGLGAALVAVFALAAWLRRDRRAAPFPVGRLQG